MVAIVIFWAAVLAIVFFLLGTFFKALVAVFNGLLVFIGRILLIGGLTLLVGVGLYLIYAITDGIINKGVGEVIGSIVLFLVVLGIIGAIFSELGEIILEVVLEVVPPVLAAISDMLNWLVDKCERGYIKFLKVIVNRLDRC